MIRSTPAVVFTSNAPLSSIPRSCRASVPFDARADRIRRRRAPRLQDITGLPLERREAIPQRDQDLGQQHAAIERLAQLALERRRPRRDLGRICGRLHVDADADDTA